MAKRLLLEIGTEELPAGYVASALRDLQASAEERLKEARIRFRQAETLGTPRRLVLQVSGVAERQEDLVQELQGPAKTVAFDKEGRPTKAAVGFAQGRGISVEELKVKQTPRGEYVFATVVTPGKPSAEILSAMMPDLIRALSFPKSMRWGAGELRFARPIRWLLALLGSQVVSFSLEGIHSAEKTYGHRQLSPGPFRVASAAAYPQVLAKTGIIVNQGARKKAIWAALEKVAAAHGGRPLSDESLLETVTQLVELPTALCGRFDQRYLSLPREVLTTAMSEHQKYFAVVDQKDELLPMFLAVSNGDPQCRELILAGHQRVLTARLEDAKFFFQEDQKSTLADKVDMLKQVIFQEDLGTLYEKTERIGALTEHLVKALKLPAGEAKAARRAGLLCKADLVTHMVGEKEFSKLQGYMGQQYALASGEPQLVAQAIFEHYLPRFAEDRLPQSLAGAMVAIADKVDTIAGCFAVKLIPSGSQDPYALRRGALGVVRILLQQGLHLALPRLVDRALDLLAERLKDDRDVVREGVLAFFRQRMEGQLSAAGLDQDVIDAVLSADDQDVLDALGRGQALQNFRTKEGFQALVRGSKRVANILSGQVVSGEPDPSLFQEKVEKNLFQAVRAVGRKVAAGIKAQAYDDALKATLDLVRPIDAFFEQILVMAEDQKIRKNRLRLLAQVRDGFVTMADYSKIVIRGEADSAGRG